MAKATGTTKGALTSVPPKKKTNPKGVSYTDTFNPSATTSDLPVPGYRDHLQDVFTDRVSLDSRKLLQQLFKSDADISAAVHAYLTVADTPMWWIVKDSNGVISRPGHKALEQLMLSLSVRFDYTEPANFSVQQKSLRSLCEELRYMILLRGAIGSELILSKIGLPVELRHVDMATVVWQEKLPGVMLPVQIPKNSSTRISLDIPTFFTSRYRQDPTEVYNYSPFISAINTIASRQQVINDLYRIMQMTGYPRMDITIIEEILRKNAPAAALGDPIEMQKFMTARRKEIESAVANLRSNQALVHFDSVEIGIVNDKMPAMEADISSIIEVLNAQNQAALKVMATIIGRGTSGVNTASVEARIFSLNAEALNAPIADLLSQAFTLALRLQGIDAVVEIGFDHVELRPYLELEAQRTMQQTRLLMLLSLGLIGDDDFHIEMFNRIRPDAIPELSGSGFMDPTLADAASPSTPGGDGASSGQPTSMDRAVTPTDSKAAKAKRRVR